MTAPTGLARVATIATRAGRTETFLEVLASIRPQVEHVFVYLDGYEAPPAALSGLDRVSVRRAEELGDLHAAS